MAKDVVDINKVMKAVEKKGFGKFITLESRKGNEIPYWIPTGSWWLDNIICSGKTGGIPGGCITEIAGLPSCVSEFSIVDIKTETLLKNGSWVSGAEYTGIQISNIANMLNKITRVLIKSRNNKEQIVYEEVTSVISKGRVKTKEICLENGIVFNCVDSHFVFANCGWVEAQNIVLGETKILCGDNLFHTVTDIKDSDEVEILDLEVPSTHCYFANDVLHHNSGKSYMAAQILANAQKMGMLCVWLDSENAADATFIEKMGADISQVMYTQVDSIEDVFEITETIINAAQRPVLIIWDSVANTPSKKEWDSSYDPSQIVGLPARTISLGLRRITNLVAETKSTFLMLNQLKTNIGPTAMSEPLVTPCGKAIQYNAHLRLFLTSRKAKSHHVFDANENKIGSDLKVEIKKSRFGTEGRKCALKILWGNGVRICDEESWIEAIEGSQYYDNRGGWKYLRMDDDPTREPVKFQGAGWLDKLKDEEFRARVKWIIGVEMVERFANKGEHDTFGFKDPDDYVAEEE